ncbi:TlpA family protein disulfide reductase [Myxococcota bacterium]|nr:TlpA family protein disulfide reductase [Myxococcota bacterium]
MTHDRHPSADDDELEAARRATEPKGARWAGRAFTALLVAIVVGVGYRSVEFMLRPPAPRPGEVAPSFVLTSLEGEPIDLEALRGKVVVLDFWATWCSGCVAFLPVADRLITKYQSQGVEWIGLHVPPGTAEEAKAFLNSKGSKKMKTAMAPEALVKRWGVAQTPSYMILDRQGRVQATFYAMAAEPQLEKVLDSLVARTD